MTPLESYLAEVDRLNPETILTDHLPRLLEIIRVQSEALHWYLGDDRKQWGEKAIAAIEKVNELCKK